MMSMRSMKSWCAALVLGVVAGCAPAPDESDTNNRRPRDDGDEGEGEGEANEGEGEGEGEVGEGEGEVDACAGDCAAGRYTACSCGTTDPCGWAEDGACDGRCVEFIPDIFYDFIDCTTGNGADVVVSGPELGAATTPNADLVTNLAPTVFTEMTGMGGPRGVCARDHHGLQRFSRRHRRARQRQQRALVQRDGDECGGVLGQQHITAERRQRPHHGADADHDALGHAHGVHQPGAHRLPRAHVDLGAIVMRNTGANPAVPSSLSTHLFVLLDNVDRPVGLGFLDDAPFASVQANQTMTMTTAFPIEFDGSSSRLRAYVNFRQD